MIYINSWNVCTVKLFTDISNILSSNEDEIDKIVKLLSIVECNDDLEYYYNLPFSKIQSKSECLNWISRTKDLKEDVSKIGETYSFNGKNYKMVSSIRQMTTAQYIDFSSTLANDKTNYSLLFALLFQDEKGRYNGEEVDLMLEYIYNNVRYVEIMGSVFFFLKVLETLLRVTRDYSIKKLKESLKMEKNQDKRDLIELNIKVLQKNGLGL